MAIHTSNVDALPHQITAVYQAMLPRQPLRFLLADDPGAGKTIMAGLFIRELMLRGDVKRCLIIAPGGLVEQWQDEMDEKFGLKFDIFGHELDNASHATDVFNDPRYSLLIARLDQISRNEDILARLVQSEWDLIVVDEAHKMAATYYGRKIERTKRYILGEKLGGIARHLLLMTATPHNGKQDDFLLFMALLDPDRFYGKPRGGNHRVDVSDMMRRMIKEDLLKFDGTPLFPERKAYTVNYKLSTQESALYEAVTEYVRDEMNRAERLDIKRKGTVGFALTILQRRLASSPEAIYRSLERRRKNLERRLEAERLRKQGITTLEPLSDIPDYSEADIDDILDDSTDKEVEDLEEKVVDKATASQTVAELEKEIESLKILEKQAHEVRMSGQDKKWEELSRLLQDTPEMRDPYGNRRKLIVFTEHRDTLTYLMDKIRGLLGREEAVVTIHGGVDRDKRREVQEQFTNNKDVLILVATDAAGEGINLQRANLLLNYDLPWNANRLEQRFGRIHRIGQVEVCHCWNMVAEETREGDVFLRLLKKLETERNALGGRVFDILGEIFNGASLKNLLIEAIRYGEKPEVRAKLHQQVDRAWDPSRIREIMEREALATDHMDRSKVFALKEDLEKAEARKLQPHFIRSLFMEAIGLLKGQAFQRETGRYEITYVPPVIRDRDKAIGRGHPVLKKYERICFEKEKIRQEGKPLASLVCPGHPLMDAVLDLIVEQHRDLLKRGAILIDPSDDGMEPRLMFILDHQIREGSPDRQGKQRTISERMQFIQVDRVGQVAKGGYAPYLDYRPATAEESRKIKAVLDEPWLKRDLESLAVAHAVDTIVPEHLKEVQDRQESLVNRTLQAVRERLVKEISYLQSKAVKFQEEVAAGRQPQTQVDNARRKAEELGQRLKDREVELEARRHVVSATPVVMGGALVVPAGLLRQQMGSPDLGTVDPAVREKIERMAMEEVVRREIALGYTPTDVSKDKCGWDITSKTKDGDLRFIEVKGRAKDAKTVTITKNEILTGFNQPDRFSLAIVFIDGDHTDGPHYVRRAFTAEPPFGVESINYEIAKLLSIATRS
jgi:superfamily II DNA or RNA helicase